MCASSWYCLFHYFKYNVYFIHKTQLLCILQAKKMNVKSLAANKADDQSVEIRIAKVAITIFFMYVVSWTPYATVALIGTFGNRYNFM